MKFHAATTRAPLLLVGVFIDRNRTFPAGTEVSATEAHRPNLWHLNAEHDGETYDGYAPSSSLEIGEVIATCNEGK